mgnify:CR=1 FL=1
MANLLPQYITDPTPQGALVRALESAYPHSLPADKSELAGFVAKWVLAQDTTRAYIGITEAGVTLENWWNQRRAGLS